MELSGKRFVVIGGAGFIGSHTVDALLKEDVREIVIYDDFSRGSLGNLSVALEDSRVRIFDAGGNICYSDLLRSALTGADGAFLFAALWLLQCQDYPRAAFDVNVAGTFNVLEACVSAGVNRLVFSSSASVYGDGMEEAINEEAR
ncbi:MAG: NAD-dependent epimerase/dehydratase family protein, partial [Anaerolineae bacterium]|nr:NAD-dependent epimerase/dehydratase family protein [Anaerolineae bacterium]